MVSNGMVDIAITDNMTCSQYIRAQQVVAKNLRHIFIDDPLYLGQVGLMVNTDDLKIRDFLEEGIKSIRHIDKILDAESQIIEAYDGTISSIFPHAPKQ